MINIEVSLYQLAHKEQAQRVELCHLNMGFNIERPDHPQLSSSLSLLSWRLSRFEGRPLPGRRTATLPL